MSMKENYLTIFCENERQSFTVPTGSSLKEVEQIIFPDTRNEFLGALVNNEIRDMHYELYKPKSVRFITISSLDGYSIYIRTLVFILYKAIKTLYPRDGLLVEHFISNGIFCRSCRGRISSWKIPLIEEKMRDIVRDNEEILREETITRDAIRLFNHEGLRDKQVLLSTRGKTYTSVYRLGGTPGYFYGTLAPRTGNARVFNLVEYKDGVLLLLADRDAPGRVLPLVPQEKLFSLFSEYKRNGRGTRVSSIGELNHHVEAGNAGEIIKISEALHEKKISRIADTIRKRRGKVKVILVAGPSSSGKTTFGKRLAVQLMVNGAHPVNLSLDNYFVNREDTPRDKNNEFDFETIDALDVDTFNRDLLTLARGGEVEIPKFSFETGKRYYDGERLRLPARGVIIVEGIHGLNPRLTASIPRENLFKIFISALTSISIDNHNIINPTDNRLIRRVVRDCKYRGYTALQTLNRWESVLAGEQRHIVPYQEEADVFFNSALAYELGVLKQAAVPLLEEVPEKHVEHSKALRLLKFFSYVRAIPADEIPPTSILREFLGGSSFKY
ncbi:MAG: nucleoside kinase [Odoribacteraceae bacterium]|jgi:uridine kinase|nr:nucleoside kinase [Odoribacteraceae bacterium]